MKKTNFSALSDAQATALFLGDKKMSVQNIVNEILNPAAASKMLPHNEDHHPICPHCKEELKALVRGTEGFRSYCCPRSKSKDDGHLSRFSSKMDFSIEYLARVQNPDKNKEGQQAWIEVKRVGTPFSVNFKNFPGVMYLTWKLTNSKRLGTRLSTLDWGPDTSKDREELMKECGIPNMDKVAFTNICRMISAMIDKWGHDFMGIIPLPDELWEESTTKPSSSPVSSTPTKIDPNKVSTSVERYYGSQEKRDVDPANTSDEDFIPASEVGKWISRWKTTGATFNPEVIFDALSEDMQKYPSLDHLIQEVLMIADLVKGEMECPSKSNLYLLPAQGHKNIVVNADRGWKVFVMFMHYFGNGKDKKKSLRARAFLRELASGEVRHVLVRDKDLIEVFLKQDNGLCYLSSGGDKKYQDALRERGIEVSLEQSRALISEFFEKAMNSLK